MTIAEFLPAWDSAAGRERVTQLFQANFGQMPAGVWSAPGRVNVIGEHTDYNGGLAMPIALPHRTFVAVSTRTDRKLRLISAQESGVRTVDLDQVGPVGTEKAVPGWPAYVAGVLWAMERDGLGPLPGLDVAVDSCVPFGAGLSSSAALECAIAVAVDEAVGLDLAGSRTSPQDEGRQRLARHCVAAENEIAGAPTGGMDQSASLRCQSGHAILLDCRTSTVGQLPFDLAAAGLELLVIDTRAPHALVDGQYAQRRESCEEAARMLEVGLLVEVEDVAAAEESLPDPVLRRRMRHVVTEIARTRNLAELLSEGELIGDRLAKAGALLNASHDSLRDDYQVSCPELDLAVDTARAQGAHGARMTGGGFGGSAIALLAAGRAQEVAAEIARAFAQAGFRTPVFLRAIPADPAGRD